MIRLSCVNLKEDRNDIRLIQNIRNDRLTKNNFTVVGIMLNDENNEIISNQLKEFNTYYYENNNAKFEKCLREYKVKNVIIGINLNNIKTEEEKKNI